MSSVGVAWAAEWAVIGRGGPHGIDVVAGDDALVKVRVAGAEDARFDVRLERFDVELGAPYKSILDVVGCDDAWREKVISKEVTVGEEVTFFLTPDLPVATYALMTRPHGSNEAWVVEGEPFWVVTQPVARVVPCGQASSFSLDHPPILARHRGRARMSTVRVRVDGSAGQGMVVNPWGHVVTAASLVGDATEAMITFVPGAFGHRPGEFTIRYRRLHLPGGFVDGLVVFEPVPQPGLPTYFDDHAVLIDRSRLKEGSPLRFEHTGELFAVRRDLGKERPLRPVTARGAQIDEGPGGAAVGTPRLQHSGLGAGDVGAPIFDYAGRVWAIDVGDGEAVWAADVVAHYLRWQRDGTLKDHLVNLNAPEAVR